MFRTLGLFHTTRCPDDNCHRPYCFFSHSSSSNGSSPSTPTPVKRAQDGQVVKKRKVEHSSGDGNGPKAGLAGTRTEPGGTMGAQQRNGGALEDGKDMPMSIPPAAARPGAAVASDASGVPIRDAAPVAVTRTGDSAPRTSGTQAASTSIARANTAASTSTSTQASNAGPPQIPRDPETLKKSPQPYAERQKALNTLYTQFEKLYRPLGPNHARLAVKHALAQEAEISAEMRVLATYKRTMHHAAVSVLKRPPPDSVKHPSVGTLRESRARGEAAAKEALSKLTYETCAQYILPVSEYTDWGYPDPTDDTLVHPPETEIDAAGQEKMCDRCNAIFIVSAKLKEERISARECKHHWGRLQPEQVEGKRKWLFTCCLRERGEEGCTDGLHVFREKDDDKALARREAYKTVKQLCEVKGEDGEKQGQDGGAERGWLEVVAIDCEMIYTTAGLSLARATIVDEKGLVVFDEKVRQKAGIIDTNFRFSGLTEADINEAVLDFDAVRQAVCMFVGPNTIIVGHGLENDLRALRLLHDKVIDTAILIPHHKGKPYRRALRDLVKEKLGYFIQGSTIDKGHSSAEDAQATLEVLKWKVRDDKTPIEQQLVKIE